MKCPKCGRFCSNVYAWTAGPKGEEEIKSVWGTCKEHGEVDLTNENWDYDNFFPPN